MKREELADLAVFVAVAEERSFTRAAVRLGMSQSALSQIIRRLETRLSMRLLARTTRSVATTEAGERLLETLGPAMSELDARLAALNESRNRPVGTISITSVEHAAESILYPVLKRFLPKYPEIKVEVVLDYGLVDIVADRFDAGIRLGEHVDKDMISVRIAPEMRQAVVGSPIYFKKHPVPRLPQDLVNHQCINLKLSNARGNYVWEFAKGGRAPRVRVDGPLAFNDIAMMREAALDGFGLVNLPQDYVGPHVASGKLIRVLKDWCPTYPGYHLYYPSRRQPTAVFSLLVEALRRRGS
jgi:DNA-binding transcriptional LysR family regulator